MLWAGHIEQTAESWTARTLARARAALAGRDDAGRQVAPSMFDPGVISFAHGEGLRRPPAAAIEAGRKALVDTGDLRIENYHFMERHVELERLIKADFERLGVPPDIANNVVLDAGTTRLIIAALRLVTRQSDMVVAAPGFYHPVAGWCGQVGRTFGVLPIVNAESGEWRAEDLGRWLCANSWAHGRFVFLLFNPTMTGQVATADELDVLARLLRRFEGIAIEDAIFADLEFHGVDAGERLASRAPERVLTCCGASKRLGLANMRLGWACGPEDVIERLRSEIVAGAATIPWLAKTMVAAALAAPAEYFETNRRECHRRACLVEQLVAEINVRIGWKGRGRAPISICHAVGAGHSILLDFGGCEERRLLPDWVHDSVTLTLHLLSSAHIAFSPGASMGFDGLRLRCNFASVGTERTYAASARAELSDADLSDRERGEHFEESFAAGRELIRKGFLDRLAPVLEGSRSALGPLVLSSEAIAV